MFAASKTAAIATAANWIEECFSVYLYTGNGSSQTITNGIDLAGKGGLVWLKGRNQAYNNNLFDTARGTQNRLNSNTTGAAVGAAGGVTSFNTNGFTLDSGVGYNDSPNTFVSWTFRKQAKFFDVVTYTGTGTARTVAHNLGSAPGMMIVKRTDTTGEWNVYHRSLATNQYLTLESTAAVSTSASYWNNTAPTSTVFSVSSVNNTNGGTYVAYLFAHDAGGFGLAGTDNVISCGSYTGNGSATGPSISLGYEPQWVMIKNVSGVGNWYMLDTMRGMAYTVGNELYADLSASEITQSKTIIPTATGFNVATTDGYVNNSGSTYIYIAIRRGPMKTPTSGTSVFTPVARSGTGSTATVSNGITTDLIISMVRNTGGIPSGVWDRLRGFPAYLETTGTASESTSSDSVTAMNNTAYVLGADSGTDRINRSGYTYANWTFGRAPGFFDEVCYTGGTGTPRVLNHNLAVAPELLITRVRNFSGEDWVVHYNNGSSIIGGSLNSTSAFANSSTAPSTDVTSFTATTYTLNTSNRRVNGAYNYVAYLFASCPGVSKVGSYTGTGTTKQIDCGFTGGARFVLIKRTDSAGDWYVWDSARGIVAGNDPYLLLNSTAAEVTSTDYVDTYNAGFEISSTAPAAINANGGTFIFLAIA